MEGMDRMGLATAVAAVGVGICWCRGQSSAAAPDAGSLSRGESNQNALWGPATPRDPNATGSGSTPVKSKVQPPGTPVRSSPQEQLWGEMGSEGRPSPRPTRTVMSRGEAAATANAIDLAGMARATHKLYIGCYSEKQWWVEGQPGEGLYVFDYDAETGGLALDQIERTVVSPSWSVVHPSSKFLFVVTEKGPDDREADSLVTSYAIDPVAGTLDFVNTQLTGGLGGNCINCIGDTAVVCTNYFTGSLASFVVDPRTGKLGPATVKQHAMPAVGPIADRQEGPHPHDLFVKGTQLFCSDLGMDQVVGYDVSHHGSHVELEPCPSGAPSYKASPGAGCRGIVPHPLKSDILYLISELDGSLDVLRMARDGSGKMTAIQSGVKTYPPTAPGGPDGKWPDRWASGLAVTADGACQSLSFDCHVIPVPHASCLFD